MQGDGVYKSTDAGKTWKHVGLADTQAIARVRVSPDDPDTVYVAALAPRGVLASVMDTASVRLVTHHDVSRADCERAAGLLREVLGS
jgi:hypothetical protein